MSRYVLAIDQGTTSTRAIVFDHSGSIVSVGQKEHEQIFPRAGWVEHDPAENGDLLFGNTDTWTLWNLTGGPNGGVHATDVSNASRTMLMDLDKLSWDPDIAGDMGIPLSMLPEIRSSSERYGVGTGVLNGVP